MLKGKPGSMEWISSEWGTSLATLSTTLERLELLSSLRDPHTGRYVHHGMSVSAGTETHAILLKSHQATFAEWQTMSMRQQMRDLRNFLTKVSLDDDECGERMSKKEKRRLVLETWIELEGYRNFIPQSTPRLDRELFLVNLMTMIAVLKRQFSEQEGATISAGA
jgi:hypothetical protein